MIVSSSPANPFSSLRAEADPKVAGPREGAATSDAAVTFASLLVSMLGGGSEATPQPKPAEGTTADGEGAEAEGAEGEGEGSVPGLRDGAEGQAGGIASLRGSAAALARGMDTDANGAAGSPMRAAVAASGGSGTEAKDPVAGRGGGVDTDVATRVVGRRGERDTTTGVTGPRRAGDSTGAEAAEATGVRAADRGPFAPDPAGAGDEPEGTAHGTADATGTTAGTTREAASVAATQAPQATLAAAASAVSAAAAADVKTVDRAMEHLDPALRGKVERVIERMASEHGADVIMLEGRRTQDRQTWLYEQGRTRPGPVVTWTQSSMHSKGLAADLKVQDPGSAGRPYEVLQQVASEEGLNVLGMKDPGHVELRTEGPEPGAERSAPSPTATARAAGARVAAPAAPAQAQAARAAGVAQVARPAGVAAGVARTARPAAGAHAQANAAAHAAAPAAVPAHARTAPRAPVKSADRSEDDVAAAASVSRSAPAQGGTQEVAAPSAPASAQPLERIEKMVAAMESRDAILGPGARRVSVRLDGTAGPVERVQVQMLDRALRSQVTVDDGQLAQRLKESTSEILRTLERGGFDARAVDVKSTGRVQGTHDVVAAAARAEGVAETVRTLFASDHGTGREGQNGRGARGDGGDARRQDGAAHHSRRDDRRKDS